MKEIRTYEISVDGYGSCKFSGRSAATARYRAYEAFGVVSNCTFREFLVRSTIRRVPNPPGVGDRILVCGKPATRVIGPGLGDYYVYDDSDVIYTAHPSEIEAAPVGT